MKTIDVHTTPARASGCYGYGLVPSGIPQDAVQAAMTQFRKTYGEPPTVVVMDQTRYDSVLNSFSRGASFAGPTSDFKMFGMDAAVDPGLFRDEFWLLVMDTPQPVKLADMIKADMAKALDRELDKAILTGINPAVTAALGPNGPQGILNSTAAAAAVTSSKVQGQARGTFNDSLVKEASLTVMRDAIAVLKQTLKDRTLDPIEQRVMEGLLARWTDEADKRDLMSVGHPVHDAVLPGDIGGVDRALIEKRSPAQTAQTALTVQKVTDAFKSNVIVHHVTDQYWPMIKQPESFVKITDA